MGLASRSVSMMRYRVRGDVAGSFWDSIDEGVRRGAFHPLEGAGDEIAMGWVAIDDFTDNEFRGASYVLGTYVALSLRVDTVRVPPRILEMQVKQESKRILADSGRSRLSAGQLREIRDRLKETLRKQSLPSIQIFDLVWDTVNAVVYFGSHAVKVRERMEDYFKKCFGLALIPLIAYIRGEELLTAAEERKALEDLRPSSFA
jgi:hypothetical protein